MRKFLYILFSLIILVVASQAFSQANIDSQSKLTDKERTGNKGIDDYCVPFANCSAGCKIEDFSFAGILNLNSGCSPNGYGVFTNKTATVNIGGTYVMQIMTGCGSQYISMWVDFNDDETFSNTERILTDYEVDDYSVTYSVDLQIPGTALPGTHRMRVGGNWLAISSPDPCASFPYSGEWEDYTMVVNGATINLDAGVSSIDMDTLMGSGQIIPKATVKNFGVQSISFPVTCNIAGTGYSSVVNVTALASGMETQVSFDPWIAVTGDYTVEVCTGLAGDEVNTNDCKTADVSTIGYDAGVKMINLPAVVSLGEIVPKATIKNYGFELLDFSVTMDIGNGNYVSTKSVAALAPGDEIIVSFDPWLNTVGANIPVMVCTLLATDENPVNDCKSQTITVSANGRQKVILEIGTGTWCGFCPYAAAGAEQLVYEYSDYITTIEWHNMDLWEFPGSAYRTDIFYNITGYPTAYFDGGHETVGGTEPTMYPYYLPKFNIQNAKPSNFEIETELLHLGGLEYKVTTTIEIRQGYNSENLAAFVVLTESDIKGPSAAFETLNFTARACYPDEYGLALDFSNQTSQTFQTIISLEPDYVMQNCEVVVFLQNMNTKEIYQGTSVYIKDLYTNLQEKQETFHVTVSPNPATDKIRIVSEREISQVEIFNSTGQQQLLKYNIGFNATLNISKLPPGCYILRLRTDNAIETRQLIVY